MGINNAAERGDVTLYNKEVLAGYSREQLIGLLNRTGLSIPKPYPKSNENAIPDMSDDELRALVLAYTQGV